MAQKIPTLGILVLGTPDPTSFMKPLREGLRELGYIEDQNIKFEFRSAGGRPADLAPLAAELVARKVDVITTFQTPPSVAAKRATSEIPIVGSSGDPIATGLAASFARPGGNYTGVTGASAELGGKNVELIREVLPSARRVAVLANASDPFHIPFIAHIQSAAKALGIELNVMKIQKVEELDRAFADMEKWRADAVMVQPSLPNRRAADLAVKHRLPAIAPNFGFTRSGGLMSYSADLQALYREAAVFIDKILKGRKPADLPIHLPKKFQLGVNLKTAKALGVTVPSAVVTRADEVIE
ncbi:MAG: ABC transporter substrate-binding protein [Xanthobacteraceae bacterium]